MSDQEFSLLDLFREEARSQMALLSQGLVELEGEPGNLQKIEPLMRAAHSLKGAARIVGVDGAVRLAHVMEDALVAAQHGKIRLTSADIDVLLRGSDVLATLSEVREADAAVWGRDRADIAELISAYEAMARGESAPARAVSAGVASETVEVPAAVVAPGKTSQVTLPEIELPQVSRVPIEMGEEEPLYDLFREELRSGTLLLCERLSGAGDELGEEWIDELTRGVGGIRGAARIVGQDAVVSLAVQVEEVLSSLRQSKGRLGAQGVNVLRHAATLFAELVSLGASDAAQWVVLGQRQWNLVGDAMATLSRGLGLAAPGLRGSVSVPSDANVVEVASPLVVGGLVEDPGRGMTEPEAERMPVGPASVAEPPLVVGVEEARPAATLAGPLAGTPVGTPVGTPAGTPVGTPAAEPEAVVRVTAQSLNRLMSLAGESLVQARWLQPFSTSLLKLKKQQDHLAGLLDNLGQVLSTAPRSSGLNSLSASVAASVEEARQQVALCRQVLAERTTEFEDHAAAAEDLNTRLYREVIVSRMRPFSDGAHGFPRMVRDMARRLDKQVRLDIDGLNTEVDRDILEKLEAPLTHLIRNAVDHGIEMPAVRHAAGKPEQGTVSVTVRHRAGMLAIKVGDDGAGVNVERLRRKIVERRLTTTEMAAGMQEHELLEFLFLPGFTTAGQVTEYSGRGVGLDVVQDTIRKIGGSVRISSRRGQGTTFHLQLPITLSVLRAVLVDIAGEPYAFPHNRIDRLMRVPRSAIRSVEHRQFVTVDGQNVGLVVAAQLLDLEAGQIPDKELSVLLLSDNTGQYGLLVEAFRGEQDLVVRPLDPRLGKVANVAAAAILDDGMPVLIADVEDLIRSMDHFIQSGSLRRCDPRKQQEKRKKRVLVVDDSITVREVERQLLRNAGYLVDVAVDGQDGLNHVQSGEFDLLVSDVDMPRMTGLELVRAVRNLEATRHLPIIIISYKDREEDRLRGLELGANYYLTKSSFHDNTFLHAVSDLIGEA